jgi:hypothetical protein
MTLIEDYLLNEYKSNPKMHRKIYYHKNKDKLLAYNNKRYANRYNKLNSIKINWGHFYIILK